MFCRVLVCLMRARSANNWIHVTLHFCSSNYSFFHSLVVIALISLMTP